MAFKKPNIEKFDSRLSKVYSTTENKEQQYDEGAATYETDLVNDLEYVAHKEAGNIFCSRVTDKKLKILDVACGTGLVGEYLKNQGYKNLHGVDFSKEMIEISNKRNVYQSLWQHDFTGPVETQELYDALICVGMFAFTIPKISDMYNVVSCVYPDGICIITVNGAAWEQLDLEPQIYIEANSHNFKTEEIIKAGYIQKEGIDSRVLVIRR